MTANHLSAHFLHGLNGKGLFSLFVRAIADKAVRESSSVIATSVVKQAPSREAWPSRPASRNLTAFQLHPSVAPLISWTDFLVLVLDICKVDRKMLVRY